MRIRDFLRSCLHLCLTGMFLLMFNGVSASHFMGGQITYEYIGTTTPGLQNYLITMKLYRDCGGCNPFFVGCQGFGTPGSFPFTTLNVSPAINGQSTFITVYDINGRMAFREEIQEGISIFDLSDNPQGTYIYRITNGITKLKTGKFIVR